MPAGWPTNSASQKSTSDTMIFWRNPKINEFWTKAALLTADDPPNFISDAANMANICLFWRF